MPQYGFTVSPALVVSNIWETFAWKDVQFLTLRGQLLLLLGKYDSYNSLKFEFQSRVNKRMQISSLTLASANNAKKYENPRPKSQRFCIARPRIFFYWKRNVDNWNVMKQKLGFSRTIKIWITRNRCSNLCKNWIQNANFFNNSKILLS